MQEIFARRVLTSRGLEKDALVSVESGTIEAIRVGVAPTAAALRVDTLLPALANLHSHSFQRAMAGMTEIRAAGRDSFWTWRSLMYKFLDRLVPAQFEAIAALTFMEMQEAGYASVGEFHYVHNQIGGAEYDTQIELSERVFSAAQTTGIGLTHLPVLYSYGGAGQQPLEGGQLRFRNSVDRFANLVSDARCAAKSTMPPDTVVGIAPHSLRATSPDDLAHVLEIADQKPVHIHIAEQPKEVTDITQWLGARPVEWLLENAPVDERWCLIHATHMTPEETQQMARSGAVAGLCPITEANLGDGPFNGPAYLNAGGAFGIGSDSNVRISLTEELRTLEYSQRLRDLSRNIMITGEGSVGAFLYTQAAIGGAQAIGRASGTLAAGQLADMVAIDSTTPALCALDDAQLLDGLAFAANDDVVTDVWSAGRHQVREGRHVRRDDIIARYRTAIAELITDL
ncbi:formimidoylglutamate deiminase [Rhodophyticola sp. CCM32]|uniref:formimidoylglutamate deiminase n=1 Tax=Rhodophyticola sp. CCM32 TaxID=2916397 RepID=UPI00107F9144|nr:formimidoylglutamate deiminase [Rhodophyticola sp. CCM32]QBY01446.1 formimidoylglutamate deiminase [Rhodophyticola sp. CCM32]